MIFLDNASTTKMTDECIAEYTHFACNNFYNASAVYKEGVLVKNQIDFARQSIAKKLGVSKYENIIFTSGATESNNTIISSVAGSRCKKVIVSEGEHDSVYAVAQSLKLKGIDVRFCPLNTNGIVDINKLEQMIDEETSLVCVMHISNETGAVNDIKRIGEIIKQKSNAHFHVDGVQAFCKLSYNLDFLDVDSYSISAHKIGGAKGIGALYVKNKNKLKALLFGGGQEYNLRSGTENVGAIMSFACASENIDVSKKFDYVSTLKSAFLDIIKKDSGIEINSNEDCLPYIISLSVPGINGETLVHMLQQQDIIISTGSACSSKKVGNRTLLSMGKTKQQILGSVRVSFSVNNTVEEVIFAANKLVECVNKLKEKLR